jgi:AraC-like DNA-binding protein
MRESWRDEMIGSMQRLVAAVQLDEALTDLPAVVDLVRGVPAPQTRDEHLFAREVFVNFALRLIDQSHVTVPVFQCRCAAYAVRTLARFADSHGQNGPIEEFAVWLRAFSEWYQRAHPPAPEDRAARILRGRAARPLRPRQLASECGCSVSSLNRRFRHRYGMSLREYLHVARIALVLPALRASHMKVESLARDAGYRSTKDFYRVFRQTTGMLPHRFRATTAETARELFEALRLQLSAGGRSSGRLYGGRLE